MNADEQNGFSDPVEMGAGFAHNPSRPHQYDPDGVGGVLGY